MQYNDLSDADARYEMLMTWLKKTPKAVDKVNHVLFPYTLVTSALK